MATQFGTSVDATELSKKRASYLSEMLNRLLAECGIDGVQLSKNTGVPVTTINRLRKAKPVSNPTLSTLVPLAAFFSITVSQLIGDEPVSPTRQIGEHQNNTLLWQPIPHLDWLQAAQWRKNITKILSEVKRWVYTDLAMHEQLFAVTMEGDSMYPRFPEGTLLIIDPLKSIRNRDFVVLLHKKQEKAIFKQVLIDGETYYIRSLNKEFSGLKEIQLNQDYQVIGSMIQARIEAN